MASLEKFNKSMTSHLDTFGNVINMALLDNVIKHGSNFEVLFSTLVIVASIVTLVYFTDKNKQKTFKVSRAAIGLFVAAPVCTASYYGYELTHPINKTYIITKCASDKVPGNIKTLIPRDEEKDVNVLKWLYELLNSQRAGQIDIANSLDQLKRITNLVTNDEKLTESKTDVYSPNEFTGECKTQSFKCKLFQVTTEPGGVRNSKITLIIKCLQTTDLNDDLKRHVTREIETKTKVKEVENVKAVEKEKVKAEKGDEVQGEVEKGAEEEEEENEESKYSSDSIVIAAETNVNVTDTTNLENKDDLVSPAPTVSPAPNTAFKNDYAGEE